MADYIREEPDSTVVERRGIGPGGVVAIVLVIIVAIVAILFASGFWSANVKSGSLPDVNVSAKGGSLPDVNVHSKELVVGTKSTTIDVPKVETTKKKVDVPVVGVKDN
ncbi:hypothetical protein GCM10009087_01710 [Sphingomonas oligophenolica]|uniref:SPOR domain-containing protein n=1 Tax=Sphingomonas oligophenolica TaxID=301154 RepID=A0ABU9Y0Y9_9SPHN